MRGGPLENTGRHAIRSDLPLNGSGLVARRRIGRRGSGG